jgi:hypothetical protein
MGQPIFAKEGKQLEDLKETCFGTCYMERWSVIRKLCKFEFIPAKEHVFMIAPNKWIISSPAPFFTSVQCDKIFTSVI